jgi:hypothetical protein
MPPSRGKFTWVRFSVFHLWLLAMLLPRLAQAEGTVMIQEAGGCLDHDRLAQMVDAQLESETIPSRLVAKVRLDEDPGFDLLSHDQVLAERRFGTLPRDCDAIHSTFAIAIAIAFEHASEQVLAPDPRTPNQTDQTKAAETSDAQPMVSSAGPPHQAETRREPDPQAAASLTAQGDAPAPQPAPPFHLVLSAAGAVLFEVLPKTAGAGTFSLKLMMPRRISLSGTFLYSSRISVPFEVGNARARLLGGQVHGCLEGAAGLWAPAACLGFSWGALHAVGQAIWDAREDNSYWLAASAKGSLRRFIGKRWGFEGSTELFINFLRSGVQDRSSDGQIENAAPVGGAISLGAFVVLG